MLLQGVRPSQVQGFAFAIVECPRLLSAHSSSFLKFPYMAALQLSVSTAPSYLVSSMNLLKVHPVPSSTLLMKMLNSIRLSIDPQSMPLITSHSLRLRTIDHYPLSLMVQSVFHPLYSPPIQSISPQSGYKDAAGGLCQKPCRSQGKWNAQLSPHPQSQSSHCGRQSSWSGTTFSW